MICYCTKRLYLVLYMTLHEHPGSMFATSQPPLVSLLLRGARGGWGSEGYHSFARGACIIMMRVKSLSRL